MSEFAEEENGTKSALSNEEDKSIFVTCLTKKV